MNTAFITIPSLFNTIVHPKPLKKNPKFAYCGCQDSYDKLDAARSVTTEGDSGADEIVAADICDKCRMMTFKELQRKLESLKISWKDFRDDGVFMEPQNSNFLFKTSFSMLGGAVFALYMGLYFLALIDFVVFSTSINHWRKPRLTSRRRTMDLCAVLLGLTTHFVWALIFCKNLCIYVLLTGNAKNILLYKNINYN
eukprot:GHVP01039669.1.p1 GENE.GHVP01039669.1~~GHVP01039669.1.p1  ORF type:complete len:197 (+),score=18.53 GHVP01039669.1:56-646(+)